MAIYIEITKVSETSTTVDYSYSSAPENTGKLSLNKSTGEISVVASAANDPESRMVSRAIRKLSQHWKKGEVPDKTCWAS